MTNLNDEEWVQQIDWNAPVGDEELERMRDFAKLSLWEKLGWLEEAQRYVEHMKARREARLSKN